MGLSFLNFTYNHKIICKLRHLNPWCWPLYLPLLKYPNESGHIPMARQTTKYRNQMITNGHHDQVDLPSISNPLIFLNLLHATRRGQVIAMYLCRGSFDGLMESLVYQLDSVNEVINCCVLVSYKLFYKFKDVTNKFAITIEFWSFVSYATVVTFISNLRCFNVGKDTCRCLSKTVCSSYIFNLIWQLKVNNVNAHPNQLHVCASKLGYS